MIIAVIPTRSGSKRIKNKNIKNLLGRSIISYTIKKLIDNLQNVIDRSKVCSEIHIIAKKK